MQKFIVKYGLAAHLAILSVAPLFLFAVFPGLTGAVALLWLSLPAALWILLEPSILRGEYLRDARRRVAVGLVRDPLFWVMLTLSVMAGICAANTGVALSYDAEAAKWQIAQPASVILPGSVAGAGPFLAASLLAATLVVAGVRHSLGRSARAVYLLVSSALAGMVALALLTLTYLGWLNVGDVVRADESAYSYVGFSFGLFLLTGTAALTNALENEWHTSLPVFFFGIGGTAVGLFCYAPVYMILSFALAELVLVVYSVIYVRLLLQATDQLKVIGGVVIFLVMGGLVVAALLPSKALTARLDALSSFVLVPGGFWQTREMLSAVALKSWMRHLWIGTGLGSFSIDFRFAATAAELDALPRGAAAVPNGWWLMLAERGVVGTVLFVLPLGFLLYAYIRRVAGWFRSVEMPRPACLLMPFALPMAVAFAFFDCSLLRADAVTALLPAMAASALAITVARKGRNVR